jgi:phosphomannomutase
LFFYFFFLFLSSFFSLASSWDMNPETKAKVQGWLDQKDAEALKANLQKRISFGTAGLRGKMEAGFTHMNELIVAQASQGLYTYVAECYPDLKEKGIVIGYDGRYNSLTFARRTAAVFLSKGVKTYLFSEVVPTPFVSYGVLNLGCRCGVMVTASHNPAADNGYKVYWANASQITTPHDKGIASAILANLEPWNIDVGATLSTDLLVDPTVRVSEAYYKKILEWKFFPDLNKASKLKIVFTPMHGVGGKWAAKAFQQFDLQQFYPVMAQLYPDPDFPTVAFPNPEEGKGALKLAFEVADSVGSSIVIANDPDSDRLAAAEKVAGTGWKPFSGNEIGTLLAHWALSNYRAKHPNCDVSKLLFVNTTVSSKMISKIAAKEGIRYEECLTGFKWIGDTALRLADQGYTLIFAFEQAIGYMVGDICPDKDGIRTAAIFGEMCNHIYNVKGSTLNAELQRLYDVYGYMAAKDSYFFCYDPQVMFKIFEEMKQANGEYPATMGKFKIARVRDLKSPGFDTGEPDNKPKLPVGSSPMVTFFFENGGIITLRGSGTEPKLKYYSELPGAKGESDAVLKEMIEAMVTTFLKPEKNGLVPPSD